jgi:hypothetical protein
MEQGNNCAVLRIKPCNVWSFEPIAVDAGKGEVIEYCSSTVLERNNVIYLEWRGI